MASYWSTKHGNLVLIVLYVFITLFFNLKKWILDLYVKNICIDLWDLNNKNIMCWDLIKNFVYIVRTWYKIYFRLRLGLIKPIITFFEVWILALNKYLSHLYAPALVTPLTELQLHKGHDLYGDNSPLCPCTGYASDWITDAYRL